MMLKINLLSLNTNICSRILVFNIGIKQNIVPPSFLNLKSEEHFSIFLKICKTINSKAILKEKTD